MRTSLVILTIVSLSICAIAVGNCDGSGNCYVANMATGTGTGADWANACTDFTGACDVSNVAMRGTTIWVGGTIGNVDSGVIGQAYTTQTFSAPTSGTLPITIIDADAQNHGTDTGWNKLYALGQVVFTGPISITTDYWTFNGQFRAVNDFQTESQGGGTYHDHYIGYRMQVNNTNGSANGGIQVSGSHVTLEYIYVQGAGLGNGQITSSGNYGQAISDNGIYFANGVTNEYVGHSWVAYTGADSVSLSGGTNFTFEYNMFTKNHMGTPTLGSQAINVGDVSNLIIRYNHFHNITGTAILSDINADGVAFVPNWYFYGNDIFWDTLIKTGANYGLSVGIVNLAGETFSGGVIHLYNNTIAGLNVAACVSTQPCKSPMLTLNAPIGGNCAAGTRNCIGSSAPTGNIYNNLWWNPYSARNFVTIANSPEWTPTGDYGEGVCAATCSNSGSFTTVGANDVNVTTGNPFKSFNAIMGTVQWYNFNFLPSANTTAGLTIPNWTTTPTGCDPNLNCESNDANYVTRGANGTVERGAFQINPRVLLTITFTTGTHAQTNTLVVSTHVGGTTQVVPICTWSSAPLSDNCPEGTEPFNKVWSSNDKTVATVDSTGTITGVSPHNAFIRMTYGGLNGNNNPGVVVTDGLGTKPVATLPTGIVRTGSPLAFSGYDTTAYDASFPTTFSDPCPVNNPPTCTRWTGLTTADQLINAINNSHPGDTIVLTAGTTYTLPGTNQVSLFLPARSNPSHKWTYIVSSAMSSLPPQGTRVSPNDAVNMPTISQTGSNIVIVPQQGSDHWWIAGINVATSPGVSTPCTNTTTPPTVGSVLNSASGLNQLGATLPDSITLDRDYFHTVINDMGHTVAINASHFAILDSYVGPGKQCVTQAQAMYANFSPGPIKVLNSFFSALGEDFIFGGGGGQSNQYVVSDVYVHNNTFWKDPTWRKVGYSVAPGITYQVENNTEFKMCQRCLLDGNQYYNNWVSGQNGNSGVWNTLTSYQQGPNAVNDDITFSNNLFYYELQGQSGTEIGTIGEGCDWGLSVCQYSSEARRINIFNNLFIMGPQGAPGGRAANTAQTFATEIQRVAADWLFQHNTLVGPYLTDYPRCDESYYFERFSAADPGSSNIWLLDNVMCRQPYGATTVTGGVPFLQDMMVDPTSVPYTTRFVGNMMQYFPASGDTAFTWPAGNATSTTLTYVSPLTGNFQLASPTLIGSDGQQTGINYGVLQSHQHAPLGTCSISGTASGVISSGVQISSSGNSQVTETIETQADGTYTIPNLPSGTYILTPMAFAPYPSAAVNYAFTPNNITVTLSSPNCASTGNNFVSTAASTFSISGTVSGAVVAGVTMTLSGGSSGSTATDSSGNYTFSGLLAGTYSITPSHTGDTFSPANQTVTITTANVTGVNFTSTATATFVISGTVTGAAVSGVTVSLTGTSSGTTTTNSSGAYSFSGLSNGTYTVTPSLTGFTFSPTSRSVTISNANVTGQNFVSTSTATFSISGTVSGAVAAGVTVTLSGAASGTTTTASDGSYSFNTLSPGSYTMTPSLTGYTFAPTSLTVTISTASITGQNFTSTLITYSISGNISGAVVTGVTLTLTGTSSGSTTSDGSGNYSFTGLAPGTYTITPSLSGFQFAPTSLNVTITNASVVNQNFVSSAIVVFYSISGLVSGAVSSGVTMTLSGASSGTTTTAADGSYSFGSLSPGSYTVTPLLQGFNFNPQNLGITITNASVSGQNFSSLIPGTTIVIPHAGPTH